MKGIIKLIILGIVALSFTSVASPDSSVTIKPTKVRVRGYVNFFQTIEGRMHFNLILPLDRSGFSTQEFRNIRRTGNGCEHVLANAAASSTRKKVFVDAEVFSSVSGSSTISNDEPHVGVIEYHSNGRTLVNVTSCGITFGSY